jgi:DNA topoisomerase IA
LGQDIHEAIQNQPEITLEPHVHPIQATLFPMTGMKLDDIRDDQDVYNLVWRRMILGDMAVEPGQIITECHKNFEFLKKYPRMTHRDWNKIVMKFIRDIQAYYDLELPEIFRMAA